MVDQTIAKPLGLIKDLKIFVDGIPYTLHFFLSIAMYWIIITQCYLDAHGWEMQKYPTIEEPILQLYKELV